ncbi:MAG: NIL domain-containing protein [Miltoncostaeaceae bacterium]
MEAGVGQDQLRGGTGGGVALACGVEVSPERSAHPGQQSGAHGASIFTPRPGGASTVPSIRVRLTFPETLVREPIVHRLSTEHDVVCNIRRADVRDRTGWVILEISGEADDVAGAREWLEDTGVRVDDLEAYLL